MESISVRDLARVADYLEQINDLRRTAYGNIRHKLVDIIVTAFTAVLCGHEDYEEMETFGNYGGIFPEVFRDCRREYRTSRRFGGYCSV
jgi:hypothetical protein